MVPGLALLLAILADTMRRAEAERRQRAEAARPRIEPGMAEDARVLGQGNNPPLVLAADLDWRYEPAYPVPRLLDQNWDGSRAQAQAWWNDEVEDRGREWARVFSRWAKTSMEEEPMILVEDEEGDLAGTWDGWHRAAVAITSGMRSVPAIVGRPRHDLSPHGRRDRAVRVYGETGWPTAVGYVLADGRWLDFGDGEPTRGQDHRNVAHLLEDDEVPPGDSRTDAMNRWMDLAQAARVHLGTGDHAMVDLPGDAAATMALLRDPMILGRWLRYARTVDLDWRDRQGRDLDLRAAGAWLREVREEAGPAGAPARHPAGPPARPGAPPPDPPALPGRRSRKPGSHEP